MTRHLIKLIGIMIKRGARSQKMKNILALNNHNLSLVFISLGRLQYRYPKNYCDHKNNYCDHAKKLLRLRKKIIATFQKIVATLQKIIATTKKNYCDHAKKLLRPAKKMLRPAKKLLRPAKKLLRPSKIFASIKSRAVSNTMFLDLIHRQFSVY